MSAEDKRRRWTFLFVLPLFIFLSLPAWYFGSTVLISLFSLIAASVIQPFLSLCIIGPFVYAEKKMFCKAAALALIANISAVFFNYLNWGISTKSLLTPDFKTVYLMYFELGIALAISAVGLLLIWIYRRHRIKGDRRMNMFALSGIVLGGIVLLVILIIAVFMNRR